jgi:hypothetical protein
MSKRMAESFDHIRHVRVTRHSIRELERHVGLTIYSIFIVSLGCWNVETEADERKIIIPRREIACRIERAAERGERLFGAVENFSHARRKTSAHGWRPSDYCDFSSPRESASAAPKSLVRRRPHARAPSFLPYSHG